MEECGLETKEVSFDIMTNMFIKANALNSNAAHEQLRSMRTTTRIKDQNTAGGGEQKEVRRFTGSSGTGTTLTLSHPKPQAMVIANMAPAPAPTSTTIPTPTMIRTQ